MAAPKGYSLVQIVLHWTIAALIFFQLAVNADMQRAFAQRLTQEALPDVRGATVHAIIGISVLVLALVRVMIRLRRGAPEAHVDLPKPLVWLALGTHILLYGFLFLMPLTGALAWFGGFEAAAVLHELGRLVLIPAILFHVAGALAEQFVFNNNSLIRIVRPE